MPRYMSRISQALISTLSLEVVVSGPLSRLVSHSPIEPNWESADKVPTIPAVRDILSREPARVAQNSILAPRLP